MFLRLSSMDTLIRPACAVFRQHLCLAARRRDLFRGGAAELVRVHRQRLRDVPASEYFDASRPGDEPALAEQLDRDVHTGVEPLAKRVQVHDLVLHAEDIVEAALGHPAMERHLTALEAALVSEARAGLRPLVAAPGLDALTRALAPADPLLRMLRPLGRLEI
jgi:hypothetical protein